MLSKQEQAKFRSQLFCHLDGLVIGPSAHALKKHGVLNYLLTEKTATLKELTKHFKANNGYLNVALRGLCSQGWLTQAVDNKTTSVSFSVTEKSEAAFAHFYLYEDIAQLLTNSNYYYSGIFKSETFSRLEAIFNAYQKKFNLSASNTLEKEVQQQILRHIEGLLIAPTLVHLGMSGMFHKYFMETRFTPEEFHKDSAGFGRVLELFTKLNWFNKVNGAYEFTEKGLFFAKRSSAYGVTVSYIPTLRKLDALIFGDALFFKRQTNSKDEQHVNRAMNVWGSGGAHAAYFRVVDKIIIEIFNKPIEKQPKGILDMGCGNGEFLQHIFSVIENQTLRGTLLDEHPLTIIGVDYNEAALKISRANLIQADIWAKIIWGDIGDPDRLAKDLNDKYGITLSDLLNVRSFLDHNRIWEEPKEISGRTSTSTGAYAYNGKRLDNNLVSESLKQHFKKWKPYVKKFGLLLIELHTVKPSLIATNIGKSAATAYDLTHGYSDQYIVEIDEFMTVLEDAGLKPETKTFKKFPNSELATVSINLFKSA